MISHYLKFSLRALKRQSGYVAINVFGLAIGIACALIIALFIINELSYDQYNEHKNDIYRLGLHGMISGQEMNVAYTAAPIGPVMLQEFPEVENFLRMQIWDETIVQVEDRFFSEAHLALADSSFFEFFSIPLIKGNTKTALTEPYSVVLSQTAATRLFGDEDPIGHMMRAGGMPQHFRVTGVMEDIPENTHFSVGMIASFTSSHHANSDNWLGNSFHTYVKLYPGIDPVMVENRFEDMIIKYIGPQVQQILGLSLTEFIAGGNSYNFFMQPLTGIRLDPSVENDHKPPKDPRYLWIFGATGLLILVIAAINFMNLSTAQAGKRAKEVGMKKVMGSSRNMLILQFLIETVVLAFLALIVALLIAEISLPYFNNLLSLQLSLSYLKTWYVVPGIIILTILVGIFAGSYPAFFLSSFSPNKVLKGYAKDGKKNNKFRLLLTILQFVISIVLITGSVIMYRQLNFMLEKDLGFDKENILVVRRAYVLEGQVGAFKTELEALSGVISVSASTSIPGRASDFSAYSIRGRRDESFILQSNWVDYDYLKTYGIKMADGRFFDPEMLSDQQAAIVNEQAIRNYKLEDPFATRIVAPGEDQQVLPVIGVVADYHFESLHNDISPEIMQFKHDDIHWGYVSIRYESGSVKSVLERTEEIWSSFTANEPMLYMFMDDDFNRLYREEEQNAYLSVIFTLLAILIASMGLYGLTAFSLQQRTREISIRKTFGASISGIWYMVCKDVMVLIAIATLIAWPLVYWVATNWLQNYHYRISLQFSDFLIGFALAIIISLLTISYRVIRTASINPAVTMRYE
jgi:putative ABC transport system permease protein